MKDENLEELYKDDPLKDDRIYLRKLELELYEKWGTSEENEEREYAEFRASRSYRQRRILSEEENKRIDELIAKTDEIRAKMTRKQAVRNMIKWHIEELAKPG